MKRKGLYTGDTRRPTKYGKSLLRKFADVLSGRAEVVTVSRKGKSKGYKEAHAYANASREDIRVVRNRIVVPVNPGETVSFSRKTGRVRVSRTIGGEKFIRERFKQPLTGPNSYKLKGNERFAVPFYRRGQIEWYYYTQEDFQEFWYLYVSEGGRTKSPFKASDIQLFTRVTGDREENEEDEGTPTELFLDSKIAYVEEAPARSAKKRKDKKRGR